MYKAVSLTDKACISLTDKLNQIERLDVVFTRAEYLSHLTKAMVIHPRKLKTIVIHFVSPSTYYRYTNV